MAELFKFQDNTAPAALQEQLLTLASRTMPRNVKVHVLTAQLADELASKTRKPGLTAAAVTAYNASSGAADPWATGTPLGMQLAILQSKGLNLSMKQTRRWAVSIVHCDGADDVPPGDDEPLVEVADGINPPLPNAVRSLLAPIVSGQCMPRKCVAPGPAHCTPNAP